MLIMWQDSNSKRSIGGLYLMKDNWEQLIKIPIKFYNLILSNMRVTGLQKELSDEYCKMPWFLTDCGKQIAMNDPTCLI